MTDENTKDTSTAFTPRDRETFKKDMEDCASEGELKSEPIRALKTVEVPLDVKLLRAVRSYENDLEDNTPDGNLRAEHIRNFEWGLEMDERRSLIGRPLRASTAHMLDAFEAAHKEAFYARIPGYSEATDSIERDRLIDKHLKSTLDGLFSDIEDQLTLNDDTSVNNLGADDPRACMTGAEMEDEDAQMWLDRPADAALLSRNTALALERQGSAKGTVVWIDTSWVETDRVLDFHLDPSASSSEYLIPIPVSSYEINLGVIEGILMLADEAKTRWRDMLSKLKEVGSSKPEQVNSTGALARREVQLYVDAAGTLKLMPHFRPLGSDLYAGCSRARRCASYVSGFSKSYMQGEHLKKKRYEEDEPHDC
jgi:hypothetical protein